VSPDTLEYTPTGSPHMCVEENGQVKCWGDNTYGATGADPRDITWVPRDQAQLVSIEPVTQVAMGDMFTCALTAAHDVRCWGMAWHNQLGDGVRRRNVPPLAVDTKLRFTRLYGLSQATCGVTTRHE